MKEMLAFSNPYWGKNMGEFFSLLAKRLWQMLLGEIPLDQLASDEIQLFVLIGVGLSSALVGTFLVLKRMTMLANSLSHTILLGIVLAYVLLFPFATPPTEGSYSLSIEILLLASLVTAVVTTFLTQLLTSLTKLQEDASIGLVFTTLFALSLVLVTMFTRNAHLGTEAVMGNADALHLHDLKLVFAVALLDFFIIFLFFKEFKAVAFDPSLARSLGISSSFFNYLLMVLVAATSIGAFRAVGVLLVLTFLVAPVLAARLWIQQLHTLILTAMGIAALCSLLAVALSRHLLSVYDAPLSTAGLAVVIMALVYFVLLALSSKGRQFLQKFQKS